MKGGVLIIRFAFCFLDFRNTVDFPVLQLLKLTKLKLDYLFFKFVFVITMKEERRNPD